MSFIGSVQRYNGHMADELDDYRKHLATAEQKVQEEFDKTIVTLSGGGLGISLTFVDKFIKSGVPVDVTLLYYTWIAWATSVGVIFASHFCSIRALRCALKQAYEGSVYSRRPGGRWAILTEILNISGAILFIAGLILIILFVRRNLPGVS